MSLVLEKIPPALVETVLASEILETKLRSLDLRSFVAEVKFPPVFTGIIGNYTE